MQEYYFAKLEDVQIVLDLLNGESIQAIKKRTGYSWVKINGALERIEKDLGFKLFDSYKGKKGIPTSKGLQARSRIKEILDIYNELADSRS